MPFFCRSGHPVVTVDQFLFFIGHLLPQEPQFDLPRITRRDLQEVAGAKKSAAGVWMVGLGMRSRRSHSHGSRGRLSCLSWLRQMLFGLRGCWILL